MNLTRAVKARNIFQGAENQFAGSKQVLLEKRAISRLIEYDLRNKLDESTNGFQIKLKLSKLQLALHLSQ